MLSEPVPQSAIPLVSTANHHQQRRAKTDSDNPKGIRLFKQDGYDLCSKIKKNPDEHEARGKGEGSERRNVATQFGGCGKVHPKELDRDIND